MYFVVCGNLERSTNQWVKSQMLLLCFHVQCGGLYMNTMFICLYPETKIRNYQILIEIPKIRKVKNTRPLRNLQYCFLVITLFDLCVGNCHSIVLLLIVYIVLLFFLFIMCVRLTYYKAVLADAVLENAAYGPCPNCLVIRYVLQKIKIKTKKNTKGKRMLKKPMSLGTKHTRNSAVFLVIQVSGSQKRAVKLDYMLGCFIATFCTKNWILKNAIS